MDVTKKKDFLLRKIELKDLIKNFSDQANSRKILEDILMDNNNYDFISQVNKLPNPFDTIEVIPRKYYNENNVMKDNMEAISEKTSQDDLQRTKKEVKKTKPDLKNNKHSLSNKKLPCTRKESHDSNENDDSNENGDSNVNNLNDKGSQDNNSKKSSSNNFDLEEKDSRHDGTKKDKASDETVEVSTKLAKPNEQINKNKINEESLDTNENQVLHTSKRRARNDSKNVKKVVSKTPNDLNQKNSPTLKDSERTKEIDVGKKNPLKEPHAKTTTHKNKTKSFKDEKISTMPQKKSAKAPQKESEDNTNMDKEESKENEIPSNQITDLSRKRGKGMTESSRNLPKKLKSSKENITTLEKITRKEMTSPNSQNNNPIALSCVQMPQNVPEYVTNLIAQRKAVNGKSRKRKLARSKDSGFAH
eukprot:Pgem_evm1s20210